MYIYIYIYILLDIMDYSFFERSVKDAFRKNVVCKLCT